MAAEQFMIERMSLAGTEVKGLISCEIDSGLQTALNAGSSQLDPSIIAVTGRRPVVRGRIVDAKTILDLVFNAGGTQYLIPHKALASGAVGDIYFQSAAAGGTQGGAGTNIKATVNKGMVIVDRIGNNGDGLFEATITILADYDGTNAPITLTASDQNLLAGTGASPKLWTIRAIKNGSAGSVLNRLAAITIDFGVRAIQLPSSNSISFVDGAVTGFSPRCNWRTADLATALAASGFSGAVAASGGLIVYIAEWDPANAGVKATGGLSLTFAAGSPWWTSGLDIAGAPLMADYQCVGIGANALDLASRPMIYANSVSIPDDNTTSSLWMIGPAKDNTTEIENEQSRIDFGLNWQVTGPSTLPWPTHATLTRREPIFNLTTRDIDYFLGVGLDGKAVSTIFKQYLRKCTSDSTPIADATTGHILLSCAAGRIMPGGGLGGDSNQLLNPELSVIATGGLTLNTSTTIT